MIDNISEVFDISPRPAARPMLAYTAEVDPSIKTDADFAKQNIRDLLETGKDTLEELIEIAKTSESPRAFEVVATLMRQLADMNTQLLDLYQKETAAAGKREQPSGGGEQTLTQINNTNTIFVGTTTELTKAIERISNGTT